MLLNIGSVMLLFSPGVGVLCTAEFCPVGALINLAHMLGFFSVPGLCVESALL